MESWKSVWTYVFYSDQDWTSPAAETFAELLTWLPAAESAVSTKRIKNERDVIVCVRLKIYRKWKQQMKEKEVKYQSEQVLLSSLPFHDFAV